MAKIAEEEDLEYKQESNDEGIDFSDELYKTVDSQNIQQLTELSEQEPQQVDKKKYLEVLSKFLNQNKQAINKLKKYKIDLKNQPQDQVLEEEYELQIEDQEQKQLKQTKLQKMKFKIEDQNEQFQFQPDEQLMEEQFIFNEFEDEQQQQWEGLQNPQNINIQQQSQREQKNEQEEIQKSQILNKIRKQIKNMRRLQKFQQMKESKLQESANVDLQKNLIDENFTISQEKLQEQKTQYLKDTKLMFQKILQQKQTINQEEKDKELQAHQIAQSGKSQQDMKNKSLQEAEKYILQKKEDLKNQYDQILQRKLQKENLVSPYSKKKVTFENFEQERISQQKEEQQEEQKDPLADIQLPGKFRYQDIYSLGQQVKSQKQTTQFKEFELNTEKRAQERQQEELQDFSQQQSKFVFKKNLMIKTTQKKKKKPQKKTEKQTSQIEIIQKQEKTQKEQKKEVRDINQLQEEKQKSLTVQQQQGNQEVKFETFGEVQLDLEEKGIEKVSEQILQQPDQTLLTFEKVTKTSALQQSAQIQQHMQFNPLVKSVQSLHQEIDKESQSQYHETLQTTEQTLKPSYQVFKQFPKIQSEQNAQERQVTPLRVEQSDVMIKHAEIWNLQGLEIKQRQQEQTEENQLVIIEQRQSKEAVQIAKSNENLYFQENTVQESLERKVHSQQIKRKKKNGSQEDLQEKTEQQKLV